MPLRISSRRQPAENDTATVRKKCTRLFCINKSSLCRSDPVSRTNKMASGWIRYTRRESSAHSFRRFPRTVCKSQNKTKTQGASKRYMLSCRCSPKLCKSIPSPSKSSRARQRHAAARGRVRGNRFLRKAPPSTKKSGAKKIPFLV